MWIRKTEDPKPQHECPLPLREREILKFRNPDTNEIYEQEDWGSPLQPQGQEGDIWVCDECLTVWQVQRLCSWDKGDMCWRRANWFTRWMTMRAYWKRKEVS